KLNSGTDSALVMQEGDVSVLSVAPADPMPTWTVSANLFASSVRMPFTILFGQQTGRLASDEDKNDWASRCNERRNTFLTDLILKFINRLIKFGVLDSPKNEEITVTWSDLLAPSEKEKILNAKELSSVAESSVRAFGISAINPNEIRAIMELEPLEEDDLEPPEIDKKGDPLVDDKENDKQKSDFAEK
ncbi:TPA: anti-CBASS protein Acb1 family protein, partial [Pasteurella multocida]